MLILTRYAGQNIRIGDDISVVVLKADNKKLIHLGIDAPRDVAVHREEIYQRSIDEQQFTVSLDDVLYRLKYTANQSEIKITSACVGTTNVLAHIKDSVHNKLLQQVSYYHDSGVAVATA